MTRRLPLLAGALALALTLAACGSDGGGAASVAPAQTKVVITAADTAPFSLLEGRYRFTWATEGCTSATFDLKQQDGSFEYHKESKIPSYSAILVTVPGGTYTLTQAEPTCSTWTVTLDRF
jgi:hypothetical protein